MKTLRPFRSVVRSLSPSTWSSLLFPFCAALAACSSASPGPAEKADAGPRSDAVAATCSADSDCATNLPAATPAGCATAKCSAGECIYAPKDEDGDGFAAADCKAADGSDAIQAGNDCNDHDPHLYPGHSEPCSAASDGATVCVMGTHSCLPDGSESSCEGTVACTADTTCVSGACVTSCTAGEVGCSGQQPQACSQGVFQSAGSPCENQACVDGACVGSCTPATLQCADATTPELCGSDGTWQSLAACVGQACMGGMCGGACTPGATTCNGATPATCDATGTWQPGTACSGETPACLAGACVACTPNAQSCADDVTPKMCSAEGAWVNQAACSGQACIGGSCGGSCSPGAVDCADAVTPKTCSTSGEWANGTPCSNQACSAGACIGSCTPSTTECSSGPVMSQSIEQCSAAGEWVPEGASCPNEFCVNFASGANCSQTGVLAPAVYADAMVADANNFYFTGRNALTKIPLTGGAATTLATNVDALSVAVDSTFVYWSDLNTNAVMRVTIAGGSAPTTMLANHPYAEITVSGSYLYVGGDPTTGSAPAVTRIATVEGSGASYGSTTGFVSGVAVDANNVYWADSTLGTISKSALSGGAVTTLAIDQFVDYGGLTLVDGFVVWTTGAAGTLLSVPVSGGTVSPVATNQNNPSQLISAGGSYVLWVNDRYQTDSSLMRVSVPGGTPALVAQMPGLGPVATNGQDIVWTADPGIVEQL